MNISDLKYINRPYYDIKEKKCCRCSINGTSKRYKLTVRHSYSFYICAGCINQLGSMALALDWADKHICFDDKGNYFFKEEIK